MKTLTKILLILGVFLFCFITTMCVFFALYQQIPETLCTLVLGSGTLELAFTAVIEIFKTKLKGGESPQASQEEKGDIGL